MNFALRPIAATVRGRSGKPCSAYSIARAATCSKLIVPHLSSTVRAACSAPGTTAGSSPLPSSVLPRAPIPVDGGALGRPALSDHRDDLAGAARIDQHQRLAAEAVEILLDHAADQQRRDAGIERIAAARQDFECRRRGQRMARRYAGIASRDQRPFGGKGGGVGKRGRKGGKQEGKHNSWRPAAHVGFLPILL